MNIRKMNSVSFRMNALVLALVIAISGILVTFAYLTNANQVDDFYKTKTLESASTLTSFLAGDALERFSDVFAEPEYQELRLAAAEREDASALEAFLAERGVLEDLRKLLNTLNKYRNEQGAKYVYILDMMGDRPYSMIVADPDEPFWSMGWIKADEAGFTRKTANEPVPPTVSYSEYGWLASCYAPVLNSSGERVACVGVDLDMTEVMAARRSFLISLLINAAVFAVITLLLVIYLMRNTVSRPLKLLTKATEQFGGQDGRITKDQIVNLPITSKDEIGVLYRKTRDMQERLIDNMDNLAAVTAEKERIGAELNIATQIQADMLPRIFPAFPERTDFDIYATMAPAKEVGGDFYDFFLVDDNHIALVMADVSGKGVPAALFMVIAKTLIKNRAQLGESPAEILKNVNNQLCDGNEAELFVTVWLAIIDTTTGKGVAANAGHEHPVVRRAGGQYELVQYRHSPAVATMEGLRFKEHSFELYPGDDLFVYTDGVPEATDAHNELFGAERMLAALNRDPEASPEQLLKNVRAEIDAFVGDAPQFDDITMLSFHYNGQEGNAMEKLRLDATIENLDQVLSFVNERLEAADCPMKTQLQIDVAAEEIYVNIAHYAYAPGHGEAVIGVDTQSHPGEVSIEFRDRGVAFDPLEKEDPDVTLSAEERSIGGLGIYMVKKSMDEVRYRREDGQNILTIVKKWG